MDSNIVGLESFEDFSSKFNISNQQQLLLEQPGKRTYKFVKKDDEVLYIAKEIQVNKPLSELSAVITELVRLKDTTHPSVLKLHSIAAQKCQAAESESEICRIFLVFEYVELNLATDLAHRTKEQPPVAFTNEEVKNLIFDMIGVGEFLQSKNFQLTDVKLTNIFLTPGDKKIKIGGIAESILAPYASKETFDDEVGNTDHVMSYESSEFMKQYLTPNPFKICVLRVAIVLLRYLSLDKNLKLQSEDDRIVAIDNLKVNYVDDIVDMLFFMVSCETNVRSDFIGLKKIRDNPASSKAKNLKLGNIEYDESQFETQRTNSIKFPGLKQNGSKEGNGSKIIEESKKEENNYPASMNGANVSAVSVYEYSVSLDCNRSFRPNMEDAYVVNDNIIKEKKGGLFSVFDGHGGEEVANYCVEIIPPTFKEMFEKDSSDLNRLFDELFELVDNKLAEKGNIAFESGATGCVVYIQQEENETYIYTANVGDTRAVIVKENGEHERLSYDHKASDPAEAERVSESGGFIMQNRVSGQLAVTRAFGDLILKKEGVLVKPFFKRVKVDPTDKFIVIASDGLWDTITDLVNKDTARLIRKSAGAGEAAELLLKQALESGTRDNTTVMVLRLIKP